ncbi:MAG: hypothetical protein ABIF77_00345 [bacterium]
MIRTVDGFYGRQRELRRVMACIGAQSPQSVSLVGERLVAMCRVSGIQMMP